MHLFENINGVFESDSSLSFLFFKSSTLVLFVSYFLLKFAHFGLIFNLCTTTRDQLQGAPKK